MVSQILYFPQTDIERKAFDHAIDRVLFHLNEQINSYEKLMNKSISIDESQSRYNMVWRYHKAALMDFETLIRELFKCDSVVSIHDS